MDFFNLRLELVDFPKKSVYKWNLRRIFIGFILYIYYSYAFFFFFMIAFPDKIIPNFFVTSQTNNPPNQIDSQQGNQTDKPPSKSDGLKKFPPLIVMVTFGFIGSVFFITRTFIRTSRKPNEDEDIRKDMVVVWYLTRPMQSILMAAFIYYAFRAGQVVFFDTENSPKEDQMNIYSLSLLAIITGAFTEQAFDKLQEIATKIFKIENQEPN